MTIKEIFEAFDHIGFLTFATIDGDYPATRIAHFFAYDNEGLYFRTMTTKPFYHQLMEHKKVSACGLYSEYGLDEELDAESPIDGNYSIRITGDIKTISPDALRNKAKKDKLFEAGVEDMDRYRTMRTFVLYNGFGEVFNFDFEKEFSDQKLDRQYFSINNAEHPFRGLHINPEKCTKCDECFKKCSFDAIEKNAHGYKILNNKCDACGDCTVVCPEKAIDITVK